MKSRLSRALTVALSTVLAAGLVVSSPGLAFAQNSPDPKEILRLISSANDKFEKEEWEGAFEDYKAAFAMYPDNSLLYRMGLTAENMGDMFLATEYYQQFVDAVPDDETAKKIESRLPELRASLPARLTFESNPAGATIHIAKAENPSVGTTPATVDIPAGSTTVYLKLDGHETERRAMRLTPGQKETFTFQLEKERVVVTSPPGQTDDGGMTLGTWGWITTGVGVGLLATGGVFSFLAVQGEDDVNFYDKRAAGASRDELADLKDSAEGYYDTSVLLYVTGGLVTAAGGTMLVIDSMSGDSGSALNLDVSPTNGGAWVGLSGSF